MSQSAEAPEAEVPESSGADQNAAAADTERTVDVDKPVRRRPRCTFSLLIAGIAAIFLAASASLAGWLYLDQYRPDQQTDPAAQKVALEAARTGTVAVLSYSPESLDKDFAAAKARLTGPFLSYYTQFTAQVVTPAAKQKAVKTAATVVRAAVYQMQPDRAKVLVFVNQNTTSAGNPEGSFSGGSLRVGLLKVGDAWLIDSFEPV